MTELLNSKRAYLSTANQRQLIEAILSKISIAKAAKYAEVSERTLRDWRRGKYTMDYVIISKLCRKARVSLPQNVELKDRYWYTSIGGNISGPLHWKRFGSIGNENRRMKKWREWWEQTGKHQNRPIFKRKLFRKPKPSSALAEFFGIMLGDGGMTKRQVTVTLNAVDDKEYVLFVCKLFAKLFGTVPGITHKKTSKALCIYVSRSNLVDFLHQRGLRIGNKIKQNLDIPDWIKKNKKLTIACVRGLVDTDGCVFTENHLYKNKMYKYKRIHFVSASEGLRKSVYEIMLAFDLKPFLRHNTRRVSIEGKEVDKYLKIFGTSNPKHQKRCNILKEGWQRGRSLRT